MGIRLTISMSIAMLSDSNGGFQNPKPLGFNYINGVLPVAADVNGDGIPDLLGPIGPEVALGKGGGTFGLPSSYEQPFDFAANCVYHDMDAMGTSMLFAGMLRRSASTPPAVQ